MIRTPIDQYAREKLIFYKILYVRYDRIENNIRISTLQTTQSWIVKVEL